jgi:acyl carrier protein
LAPGGRFVEIGKTDIWTPERVKTACSTAEYSVFDLPALCERDPGKVQAVLEELMRAFEAGSLRPIPHRRFALTDAVEAFRLMQRAEHVGKLVLTVSETESAAAVAAPRLVRDATYLITGGLGDLGLLVARWMIERGACHVLLLSRRDVDSERRAKLDELEALGGQPKVVRGDVSNWEQVSRAVSDLDPALPLKGVVHAAGVLDDALMLQQDEARFQRVLAPKVLGAWHLHEVTKALPLDFFFLFASVAGLLGSKGQANHSAANTFLDGLAHHRRSLGLPATSIDWGIWSELGAAARKGADAQSRFKAMGHIPPARGLEAFERVFNAASSPGAAQVAVVPIDWQQLSAQAEATPLLDDFRSAVSEATAALDAELLKRLQDSPLDERRALLEERLSAQVAQVLGWGPERVVDAKLGFFDTGMDSLTSLELRNLIQRSFGCALPSTVAFDYPTIEALAGYLLREIPALQGEQPPNEQRKEAAPRSPRTHDERPRGAPAPLSSSDVRDLLDQQLMSVEALLDAPQDEAGT